VTGFRPFTSSLLDYNKYIRLVEYFDNALFKMLSDFVPERASLSTGVTVNSPALERNKVVYANPTNTTTQSVYEADYSIASISSSYGIFYNALSSSNNTMGWYDGELSGSIVDVNDYYNFTNPYTKPYKPIPGLGIYRFTNTATNASVPPQRSAILTKGTIYNTSNNSFTTYPPGGLGIFIFQPPGTTTTRVFLNSDPPIVNDSLIKVSYEGDFLPYVIPILSNDNEFLHSDYNVLLNNISQSIKSSNRDVIEYIGGDLRPTSSITYPAELQDSYLSLQSYNNSRYTGTKLTSLKINTYTSASYTGSDGITVVNGDNSYGKTAAIDRYTRRIGLFTQIETSSFLPKRNNVALKYLVDEFGGLTELNQLNNNWEDIQRTFTISSTGSVALFNNKQYSNQVTTDGSKIIFDSGYSYQPVLYFGTGSVEKRLYFDSILPQLDSYTEARISIPTGENNRIRGNSDPRDRTFFIDGGGRVTIPGPTGPNGAPYFTTSSIGLVYNLFRNVVEGSEYFTPGSPNNYEILYTAPRGGLYNINVNLKIGTYSNNVVGTISFISNLIQIRPGENVWSIIPNTTNTKTVSYVNPTFNIIPNSLSKKLVISPGSTQNNPNPPNSISIDGRPVSVPPGTTIGGVSVTSNTVYAYNFPAVFSLSGVSPYLYFWDKPQFGTYPFTDTLFVQSGGSKTYYSFASRLTFGARTSYGIKETPTTLSTQLNFYYFYELVDNYPTQYPLYSSTNAEDVSNFGEKISDLSVSLQNVALDQNARIGYLLSVVGAPPEGIISYIPPVSSTYPQQFTVSSPEISTGNYPFVSNVTPFISASSSASLLMNTGLSNFYGGNYTHLPTFQTGSQTYTSSLYSENGDVDYPLVLFPGSIFLVTDENGRIFESVIQNVITRSDGRVQINLNSNMSNVLQQQINSSKVLEVVFLNKIKDETSVILKFIKKPGQTSYGLLIPDTLAPDVLNNIDTITRQVKQKLLSDQQSTTQ
jgi:hypothetical protein